MKISDGISGVEKGHCESEHFVEEFNSRREAAEERTNKPEGGLVETAQPEWQTGEGRKERKDQPRDVKHISVV